MFPQLKSQWENIKKNNATLFFILIFHENHWMILALVVSKIYCDHTVVEISKTKLSKGG